MPHMVYKHRKICICMTKFRAGFATDHKLCLFLHDYLRRHLELLPFRYVYCYVHLLRTPFNLHQSQALISVTLCRYIMPLRYASLGFNARHVTPLGFKARLVTSYDDVIIRRHFEY